MVYDKYITSHIAFLAQYAQIAYFFHSINDLRHLKQMQNIYIFQINVKS